MIIKRWRKKAEHYWFNYQGMHGDDWIPAKVTEDEVWWLYNSKFILVNVSPNATVWKQRMSINNRLRPRSPNKLKLVEEKL